MASFLRLWNSRHCAVDDLSESIRVAEVNKDREMRASITIQSIRRGMVARRQIKARLRACVQMQRILRGYLARQYACHVSMHRDKQRALKMWTRAATLMQKTFRAFYSRRYKHSFYERAAYLRSVATKDEMVRADSEALAEQVHHQRELQRHEEEKKEFLTLSKDLHHLVSTSNTPGVFNSPYNIEPLKAFGAPVETHLKTTFAKSKYLQRHMMRSLGAQRYRATNPESFDNTQLTGVSQDGSYTHASFPRPLEPLAEEPGRQGKRATRVA